jgi:beta-glucosidase
VEFVHGKHRVAGTAADGIRQAVEAGMNIRTHFTPPEAYVEPLRQLVKSGALPIATIDARVRDILRVKYWIGLFDAPYRVEPAQADKIVRAPQHLAAAARANHESIVLLDNAKQILPLKKTLKKLLVAGPLADDMRAWWCRYGPQGLDFVTPLAGIRAKLGSSVEVRYARGVDARDANWPESDIYKEAEPAEVQAGIADAVRAASGVDVIILVVGEPEELSRESRSRISLSLPGYQEELLRALHATGVPVVVVLSNGRPLSVNFAAKHAAALLEVWYPGEAGGTAIADTLFGDYNPAGRLPITIPRSVGQVPLNFPYKPGAQGPDEGQVTGPLFAFGHGLSYSKFAYDQLQISPARLKAGGKVQVSVDVTNTSARAGEEVVQMYLRDDYSSVTTFEKNLRGFERVRLAAGEKRRVKFTIAPEHLALFDAARRWTVEPGRFTLMVGASSVDIRQSGTFIVERPDGSAPNEDALPVPK